VAQIAAAAGYTIFRSAKEKFGTLARMGIDPMMPSGSFMFNILGAPSSLESEIIVERTRAGLIAAARGHRGGWPPALDESQVRAAKAMLASGKMSAIEVAQQLGCAASTLYRHLPGGRSALTAWCWPTSWPLLMTGLPTTTPLAARRHP
jgi:DNA invertase Pin-like site-specific DNA recombinase